MLGKDKCRILRTVRRMIAEANEIPFDSPDCTQEGPCLGTCPKCESELRYLEQQLQKRRAEGREIELAELCAGVDLDCGPEPIDPPEEWPVEGFVTPREELAGLPLMNWDDFDLT